MDNFFEKISVLCFAASYLVSFLLEVSRLLFKSGLRGFTMLGFAIVGLFAHSSFLVVRSINPETGPPLSSAFDFYLLGAWLLTVIYIYLTIYHPKVPIGLFLLPAVLGAIGAAQLASSKQPVSAPSAIWGPIHGIFLLLGSVAVVFGLMSGIMYLWQLRRLKKKQLRPGFQLPSLEWLERNGEKAIIIAIPMLIVGIASGILINTFNHVIKWNDPIVWTSGFMLIWMIAIAIFTILYKPARRGRKVAYLTFGTFIILLLVFGVSILLETSHGIKPSNNSTGRNTINQKNDYSILGCQIKTESFGFHHPFDRAPLS